MSEFAKQLDEKGRCCGRKPITYKRPRHLFCFRCDRAYDFDTGHQIENWAWKDLKDGTFISSKREAIKDGAHKYDNLTFQVARKGLVARDAEIERLRDLLKRAHVALQTDAVLTGDDWLIKEIGNEIARDATKDE